MKRYPILLSVLLLMAGPALAQVAPAADANQALLIFVQKAVVRALNFKEGDTESLTDARYGFTLEGWHEFMRPLNARLDEIGAPRYSSAFLLSGVPGIVSQENGVTHVALKGKLTQTHNEADTVSFVMVDVHLSGNPARIEQFKMRNCADAACN